MPGGVELEFKTKEFKRFISNLDKTQRKRLKKVVDVEGKDIRSVVSRKYATGLNQQTGNLAKSFRYKLFTRLLRKNVLYARISSFYFTSLWFERGWTLTGHRPNFSLIKFIPGKWYLRDTVDLHRPIVLQKVVDHIRGAIRDAERSR